MRNPLRTEAEAFSFVLAAAVCFLALGLAAVLGGAAAALAAFLALFLGAAVGIYLKSDPPVREPAVWARRPPGEGRRILVVANETLPARALREEVRHRSGPGDVEVLLVAPALDTSSGRWTADEDASRGAAAGRLDEAVTALAAEGVPVRGAVGDRDPLRAIEAALRTFAADEVLIATHPHGRSAWVERGLVAEARARFDVPVVHLVVDLEHEQARGQTPAGR